MATKLDSKAREMNLIWKHTHKDYKGKVDGRRYILVYRNGTTSVPLDSLTAEEHAEKLAYAKHCEARGKQG